MDDGGNNVTNVQKSNSEIFGPGTNLRPQQQGNWLNKQSSQQQSHQQSQSINNPSLQGNQQPNTGNYVNGQLQQDDLETNQQRAYNTAQSQPIRTNKSNGAGYNRQQNYPQRFNNQQYQSNQRQYDNRNRQQNRIREDMPERAKVAILSEKELQGFDELLDDDKLDDWTKTKNQIDFNAKFNFSEGEDEDARSLNDYEMENKDLRDDLQKNGKSSTTTTTTATNQENIKPLNKPSSLSQSNEQQPQHSRYRRDYQNPKPHQSYNSSNKYERNPNYQPQLLQQQQQQQQPPIKNENPDDNNRMKQTDLNESKRRSRDDEDRKYNQPSSSSISSKLDKQSTDQSQLNTNFSGNNKSMNRNNDEMMSNNSQSSHGNLNLNYNNRQFQQSLPPRFQKLQQNTNQSSSYNRFDTTNRNQSTIDKDRKRNEPDDDYQNKRNLNRQTSWRNNRELSKSQEKSHSQITEEPIKKDLDSQIEKSTVTTSLNEQINLDSENSGNKIDLDLKSSTSSNQLLSSSNSSSLMKKISDDKSSIKDVGGDSLKNDSINDLTKNTSQLSINEKESSIATKSSDKSLDKRLENTKDDEKSLNTTTVAKSTAIDSKSTSGKQLNVSQESKYSQNSELNKYDQQHSFKNQQRGGGYDNRPHYRQQDDYRMYQRDYRNNRPMIDNRGNDKMNPKNTNKKHEYVEYVDYRGDRGGRDYNQMNRTNKYDLKKDDKYAKINQQQHSHNRDAHKPIAGKTTQNYLDKPNRRLDKEQESTSLNKSTLNELSSSQNDKFDKKQTQQSINQPRNKDRKSDHVLDDSASSGFLPNKKQLKYPTNQAPTKHSDDLSHDKNRPRDKMQQPPSKLSNYERKNDQSSIRTNQPRKLSQDVIEKTPIKSGQDDDSKKKEILDKPKTKNEEVSFMI